MINFCDPLHKVFIISICEYHRYGDYHSNDSDLTGFYMSRRLSCHDMYKIMIWPFCLSNTDMIFYNIGIINHKHLVNGCEVQCFNNISRNTSRYLSAQAILINSAENKIYHLLPENITFSQK